MREILLTTGTAVALLLAASATYGAGQGRQGKQGKPAAKNAAAPAVKIKTTELPDGTGTIGMPAGWVFTGAYRGTVFCRGPQGSSVTMGHAFVISRPDHPAHQLGIATSAPMAPDGDLVAALKGVLRSADNRLISLRTLPAPPSAPGVPAVYYLYELESKGKRLTALGYFTTIAGDDGSTLPYWQMYCSVVMAPKETFMKELPTLMAMWNSWRPNGQKPRAGSEGAMIDAVIADSTRRRAQSLKEQQEMFDRMNARFKEAL
jgi:hypothetical protein